MEWAKANGRGKVFAFNIHYVAFVSEVNCSMQVEVVYEDITPEHTLPEFRPVK